MLSEPAHRRGKLDKWKHWQAYEERVNMLDD